MDALVVSGDLSPDYDVGSRQQLTITPDGKLRADAAVAADTTALETLASTVDANNNIRATLEDASGSAVTYDDLIETKVVKVDITVDTAAYADNDSIGGLKTLTDFARTEGGSGTLTRFQLRTKLDFLSQSFLHIFDANPTASTFTDNAALVIHANDETKLLKSIAIAAADWVSPKGQNPWHTFEAIDAAVGRMTLDYQLASGRDLYFALEADGAVDFVAATDLKAIVAAQNN